MATTLAELMKGVKVDDFRVWMMKELHVEMTKKAPDEVRRAKYWPKSAAALSNRLDRIEGVMQHLGYEIQKDRTKAGARVTVFRVSEG